MVVHFKERNLESSELDLAARLGGRIALRLSHAITSQLSVLLEPYYQRWDLARSAAVPLKANGMTIGGSITQPRSETRNSGLNLRVIYHILNETKSHLRKPHCNVVKVNNFPLRNVHEITCASGITTSAPL